MAYDTKFHLLTRQLRPNSFKGMGGDPRYNQAAWRKLAKRKKEANPLCEVEGCNEPTHTIDHINPVNMGGKFLCKLEELMALCKYHNFSKTARQKGQYQRGEGGTK